LEHKSDDKYVVSVVDDCEENVSRSMLFLYIQTNSSVTDYICFIRTIQNTLTSSLILVNELSSEKGVCLV